MQFNRFSQSLAKHFTRLLERIRERGAKKNKQKQTDECGKRKIESEFIQWRPTYKLQIQHSLDLEFLPVEMKSVTP